MATIESLQEMFCPDRRRKGHGSDFLDLVPRITCTDGFSMSVQTGHSNYCEPRNDRGPWYSAEVGFPSANEDALMHYIDGEGVCHTEAVYGYVPLEVIAEVIDQHGGIES